MPTGCSQTQLYVPWEPQNWGACNDFIQQSTNLRYTQNRSYIITCNQATTGFTKKANKTYNEFKVCIEITLDSKRFNEEYISDS